MTTKSNEDSIRLENNEWRDSLDYLYKSQGAERVRDMFRLLQWRAQQFLYHGRQHDHRHGKYHGNPESTVEIVRHLLMMPLVTVMFFMTIILVMIVMAFMIMIHNCTLFIFHLIVTHEVCQGERTRGYPKS